MDLLKWNLLQITGLTGKFDLPSLPKGELCSSYSSRPHAPFSSVQFSSVAQSCPTVYNPMNRSTPGLPVHHQLPEFTQIHVHRVGDAIQPSHPRSSPSPPAPNPSQHQSFFQWVNPSHEAKSPRGLPIMEKWAAPMSFLLQFNLEGHFITEDS